jgi:hypothetical protein
VVLRSVLSTVGVKYSFAADSSSRLILEIDVGELLAVVVADAKARVLLLD